MQPPEPSRAGRAAAWEWPAAAEGAAKQLSQKSPIGFDSLGIVLRALTPALAFNFFLVSAVFLVCVRLSDGPTKGHPSCIADAPGKHILAF